MRSLLFPVGVALLLSPLRSLAGGPSGVPGKLRVGITATLPLENDVVLFEELVGAPSFSGDGFYSLGICLVLPLGGRLDAESGMGYSRHRIRVEPNLPPQGEPRSDIRNLHLIDIPVTLLAGFLKYFFVNGGLVLEIDPTLDSPLDNQSGIGALAGIGFKYDFRGGLSLFLNPCIKGHALLPFSMEGKPTRIIESGVRLGISFGGSR